MRFTIPYAILTLDVEAETEAEARQQVHNRVQKALNSMCNGDVGKWLDLRDDSFWNYSICGIERNDSTIQENIAEIRPPLEKFLVETSPVNTNSTKISSEPVAFSSNADVEALKEKIKEDNCEISC